jgi:hypothetical protein
VKSKRARIITIGIAGLAGLAIIILLLVLINSPKSVPNIPMIPAMSDAPYDSVPPASPAPDPPTPTAAPLARDALVVVRATATDSQGAQLSLEMVVHQPVSINDASAATDLASMNSQCRSDPNLATIAEPTSGIERADVTAVPLGSSTWHAASEISVFASNNNIRVRSGSGIAPSVHYQNDPPLHDCEVISAFFGPAHGTVSVLMWAREGFGLPVQSPNYFRWVQQEYGFFAADGPNGSVTLSDCTIDVTDAARAFGWDASLWHEENDPYVCEGSGVVF